MKLSQLTRFAKRLGARLSTAANQLFRHLTQPATTHLVTGTLADLPRNRSELLAENPLLRHQLIGRHRQVKTPRLTWHGRLSLLLLARLVPSWKQVLPVIQPETLLRWHRVGFRLFWRIQSRSRQPARRLDAETIALIQRLAGENRLSGADRIRGELLKLSIRVANRTIQKYMRAVCSESPAGPTWSTRFRTHGRDERECRFVMAHELLHVGLRHQARRQGRDPFLWNAACDYVINAWLMEMQLGDLPAVGALYDPELKGLSAEAIYDRIVTDLRRYRKLATLRGVGLATSWSAAGRTGGRAATGWPWTTSTGAAWARGSSTTTRPAAACCPPD